MSGVLKSKTSADWLERLDAHDVPCAPVLTRPEILENEQIKANELIHQYEHPKLGEIRQPRPGARFSKSDIRTRSIAPSLGEHSISVLEEYGYSTADIDALVNTGVVKPMSED